MTVRTLAEAAADVLARSKAVAPSEPMNKSNANWTDLGGSTLEDPAGGPVGTNAAALVGSAKAPGAPAPVGQEPMKKLAPQPQQAVNALVSPPAATPSGAFDTAGHPVANVHEDEEYSEEEVISEEEFAELSEEDLAEIREAKLAMVTEKIKQMGIQEDIDALFNGEVLDEAFQNKAATLFEAAVIARAVSVVEELENDILEAAEESVNAIKQELEEQVDAYLNYMVQEWVNENKVAIESGLKNEIMENFVEGLKNLFAENYIEVPEEKLDVVESMADEIESLKSKLNEAINDNIELATAITEATKSDIIHSVCEGLTATQSEKVKTLAEGVEFTTEGEYAEKVKIIRESYFTNNVDHSKVKQVAVSNPVALTEAAEPVQVTEVSPSMQKYINAIGRTLPR